MRLAIVGFVGGVGWLQTQGALPGRWVVLACALLAGALLAGNLLTSATLGWYRHWLVAAAGGALCGVCWAALLAHSALAPQLASDDEGRELTVVGTIDSLPYRFEQGVRFQLRLESVTGATAALPPRLGLSWYAGYGGKPDRLSGKAEQVDKVAEAGAPGKVGVVDELREVGEVAPGERWQLNVRLQRPHGSANPYGFDYEAWLLEQGVRATGYVRGGVSDGGGGGGGGGSGGSSVDGGGAGDRGGVVERTAQRADNTGTSQAGTGTGTASAAMVAMVATNTGNRRLSPFVWSVTNVVERCRAVLRARILAALPDRPYAGVIVALVVGDQRAIEQSDWTIFSRTGVSHLISISGLHITMVAGMVALLMAKLWRHSFFTGWQLPLLLPAQKVAALAGATTALLYVLLAGFGVPAQRTLYMLAVVALALWTGRLTSISHVLCAALALVVLLDPWAVLAPGFWLSFGAVGLIVYASVGRTSGRVRMVGTGAPSGTPSTSPTTRPSRPEGSPPVTPPGTPQGSPPVTPLRVLATQGAAWCARLHSAAAPALRTQYVVTVGLVPLTLLLFAQVSLISPVANALAIPLISFVVTPLALAGSMLPSPLSGWLLVAAHAVVEQLAAVLAWLGGGALAVWSAPAPSPPLFAFALVGTVWLLAPRGWPHRWAGLAAWLPALSAAPTAPAPGSFDVTVFDVGQGMAVLIETAGHRVLYDAGPQYSVDGNGGNRVIVPYLKGRGIDRLDMLVISHSDADHAGGALAVLQAVAVDKLLSSLPPRHRLLRDALPQYRAPPAQPCSAGQHWQWEGVRFDVLHPLAASHADASLKPNARSCTLRISNGAHTLLAAADIEAAEESQLLGRAAAMLPADVLLAPHHGSGTSSTAAFLQAVHPSLAVFQVGHRNRYRHPQAQVWQRYGDAGIDRVRTDQVGAVLLRFCPDRGTPAASLSYRASHARYWYGH